MAKQAQTIRLYYAPDFDSSWDFNPGVLTSVSYFAPLQLGGFGSTGTTNYFGSSTITGTNHLSAYMFRQTSGAVRFLCFRKQDIDEYDSSATRTNRGTGYNASTASWRAAAFGNQIIACNYLDATQSSTGAGFSGLGGGSPKARHVACNQKFVLLADYDDGTNQYADGVWWSALYNANSWTPSVATQAGNVRLLDAPGPITAIASLGDSFIAFKQNAIFVGRYVGPGRFIWEWRLLSNRVGCIAPDSVVSLDGRLLFLHSSGFYETDGATIRNIGLPVNQTFLRSTAYISGGVGGVDPPGTSTPDGVASVQGVADDIEGVAWWKHGSSVILTGVYSASLIGYNVRTERWGQSGVIGSSAASQSPIVVNATSADVQAFKAAMTTRFLMIYESTGTKVFGVKYPSTTDASTQASFSTGKFGREDGADTIKRIYPKLVAGSDTDTGLTAIVDGATAVYNSEFTSVDILSAYAKYHSLSMTWSAAKKTILTAIRIDQSSGGPR